MTTARRADVAPVTTQARWGMGDAVVGWFVAQSAGALVLLLVLQPAFGYSSEDLEGGATSIGYILAGIPALWVGFVGLPIWVAAKKGNGWVSDFGVRVRSIDVPIGVAGGLVAQFVLVPLVTAPLIWWGLTTNDDVSAAARDLADKVTSPGWAVLFFLLVAVATPFAEELFFRGLVLRSIEKRFGTTWAVIGSSLVFAATHFQVPQFAGLTAAGLVFALLAVKTGRLGPAIFAHIVFNASTVIVLLWFT